MGSFLSVILIVALWDLIWKALAMWKAAKRSSKVWFVVLLVLNTAGLLPILYLGLTKIFDSRKNKALDLSTRNVDSKEAKNDKDSKEVKVSKKENKVSNESVKKKLSKKKTTKKKASKKKVPKKKVSKKKVEKEDS